MWKVMLFILFIKAALINIWLMCLKNLKVVISKGETVKKHLIVFVFLRDSRSLVQLRLVSDHRTQLIVVRKL